MEEEIELIPVEGKSGFYRDPESTAVINCDKKAYSDYMKRKKIAKIKNSELDQMKPTYNHYFFRLNYWLHQLRIKMLLFFHLESSVLLNCHFFR